MPLDSYEFMLAFLPIAFVGHRIACRYGSHHASLGWLLFMSGCFYVASGITGFMLTALSIGWDYVAARAFLSLSPDRSRARKTIICAAISADILFLCYFKYFNSLFSMATPALSSHLVSSSPYLPLGLSFLTFQKIGLLSDLHSGQIKNVRFLDFVLFGLFFPKTIAGPIIRYNGFISQLGDSKRNLNYTDTVVGVCLLAIGLFKGTVMASVAGQFVDQAFDPRFPKDPIDFFPAWFGALGFTFQIYFEFSGYSDMALGTARLFGIQLPMNFNSPLKSRSLVEFWSRWHISLTRFLTWQIYIPMVRYFTRMRINSGRSVLRGASSSLPAIAILIGIPTVFTMTISGLWHGSGYTYVLWGFMHGVCLSVNQGWRLMKIRLFPNGFAGKQLFTLLGRILTVIIVIASMVVFRADTLSSALAILKGMTGLNGFVPKYMQILMSDNDRSSWEYIVFDSSWYACVCLSSIALITTCAPNSLELLKRLHPALDYPQQSGSDECSNAERTPAQLGSNPRKDKWKRIFVSILRLDGVPLTFPAVVLYAIFLVLGISAIERAGVFIYGQF